MIKYANFISPLHKVPARKSRPRDFNKGTLSKWEICYLTCSYSKFEFEFEFAKDNFLKIFLKYNFNFVGFIGLRVKILIIKDCGQALKGGKNRL